MPFFVLKKAGTFKRINITNNGIKKTAGLFYIKLKGSLKLVNIDRAYSNIFGIVKAFFVNLASY